MLLQKKHIRVVVEAGGEDVIFICRQPSAAERSKFLSSRFVTKRNKMVSRLYEARAEFVDQILLDVENIQYCASNGEIRQLNAQAELSDADKAEYSTVHGVEVRGWRDMIPLNWKSSVAMYFEDQQSQGEEDAEGN